MNLRRPNEILTDNDDVKCINDVIMTSFLILPNHFCHFSAISAPDRYDVPLICCIGLQPNWIATQIGMQLKSGCNPKEISKKLPLVYHCSFSEIQTIMVTANFSVFSFQTLFMVFWKFYLKKYWTAISVHCPPVCKTLLFSL